MLNKVAAVAAKLNKGFILLIMLSIQLAWCPASNAEILVPKDYAGKCRIKSQEAVSVFHAGKQSLAVVARYEFQSARAGRVYQNPYARQQAPLEEVPLPAEMVWVVPVNPSVKLLDPPTDALFEDLYTWTHPSTKGRYGLRTGRPMGLNRFGESAFGGVSTSEQASIAWNIVPGTGEAIVAALKNWMETKNLKGLDENLCRQYALNGWTFILGTVANPPESGILGPVNTTQEVAEAAFPMKFQANTGPFDFNIYLLTEQVINTRPISSYRLSPAKGLSGLSKDAMGRGYVTLGSIETPPHLTAYVRSLKANGMDGIPKETLNLYAYEGKGLNPSPQVSRQGFTDLTFAEHKAPSPAMRQPGIRQPAPAQGQRQASPYYRRGY